MHNILMFSGVILGGFCLFIGGGGFAQEYERDRWCKYFHEKVVDYEACKESPPWKKIKE